MDFEHSDNRLRFQSETGPFSIVSLIPVIGVKRFLPGHESVEKAIKVYYCGLVLLKGAALIAISICDDEEAGGVFPLSVYRRAI